jgi:hypothetical protein
MVSACLNQPPPLVDWYANLEAPVTDLQILSTNSCYYSQAGKRWLLRQHCEGGWGGCGGREGVGERVGV